MHTPAPGSRFGASNGASPPGTSQQPMTSGRGAETSQSLPPRRRTGLIFAILLVDLALAGAGAYLLIEGLASGTAPAAATTPGSAAAPESAGSSAKVDVAASPQSAALASTPPPDAAPIDAALVVTPIPVDAAELAAAPPPDAAEVKKPAARKQVKDRKKPTQPVDPYDDPGVGPDDPFPPDLPPPPPPPPDQ
jgi:hypothetical protein